MLRLIVDSMAPDRAVLDRAADAIRAGGIVALPTDTLYGLAADPFSEPAVRRLVSVKGRTFARALPLIAADLAQIVAQLGELSTLARVLAARFWPGPLTLLVPAPEGVAAEVSGGTGRVGVRVPAHGVARGLCHASGRVLTATSANLTGRAATQDPVSEAMSALIALGYKPNEASRAVRAVPSKGLGAEEIIRQALKGMAL